MTSARLWRGPAQQGEKLGEHHRRRAPDFLARYGECRNVERDAVALTFEPYECRRIEQLIYGHVEDAGDLAVDGRERWTRRRNRDDGMETKTADWNVERRQRADHTHAVERKRDLFMRIAQRRLLERLTRLEHAARQRHLTAVPPQCFGAHGQDDVCAVHVEPRRTPSA